MLWSNVDIFGVMARSCNHSHARAWKETGKSATRVNNDCTAAEIAPNFAMHAEIEPKGSFLLFSSRSLREGAPLVIIVAMLMSVLLARFRQK
jgi:hypothetical protein